VLLAQQYILKRHSLVRILATILFIKRGGRDNSWKHRQIFTNAFIHRLLLCRMFTGTKVYCDCILIHTTKTVGNAHRIDRHHSSTRHYDLNGNCKQTIRRTLSIHTVSTLIGRSRDLDHRSWMWILLSEKQIHEFLFLGEQIIRLKKLF